MSNKKTVKILYLMEYPIDLPGGGQMSTQTLCEGITAYSEGDCTDYKFDSLGKEVEYETVVACPKLLQKSESDYSFRIVTYPSDENRELSKMSRIKNFVERIGHFRRIIKAEKPDLIHISMSESLISFGFLRCLGMFSNIPFVYTDRGLCYGYRRHSKLCIKATMKHAARMLTTTEYNKHLWEQDNIDAQITAIPNTIGKAFDNYDEHGRKRMRRAYGISDGELVIGFAGRISEEKDWPGVPPLVKALYESGLRFKVALVLSVYEDRDAQLVRETKTGITDVIDEENLIFLQDLSQAEISEYYYLVDVFIMTSNFESFGKAAVEAMSRKCVVVSTKVGGLPEVIGKPEDLYDKDEPEYLAGRIANLHSDKAAMDSEREYFYNRYKDNYTKEKNITRHIDLYESILGI